MKTFLNNSSGAITPLALIVAFYMTVTSFYLLFLLHKWHLKVEIQYRLDRCVAEKATTIRDRLQALENGNLRMQWARILAKATIPFPPATVAARAWNTAEFAFQMARLSTHFVEYGLWTANSGCQGEGSGIFFLPRLPYAPAGADELGPRPLKYDGRTTLTLHLARGSRNASVTLYASPSSSTVGAIERVIPEKLKELLENPAVKPIYQSMGPMPFPTKQWRSAWVPLF